MKRWMIYVLLSLSFLWQQETAAQDLHFSQYLNSPVNLNPALTGFTSGNLRVNANYRNQWFALNSFATYAVSADANLIRSKLDYNVLGVGLSFYQDIEESKGLSNTNLALSSAFNLKLSERPMQYIGLGLRAGLLRKQINLSDAVYGTFYEDGNNFDPIGNTTFAKYNFDLELGVSYYLYFDDRHMFMTGFSMGHINRPNEALLGKDRLYHKYTAYLLGQFEMDYNSTFWFRPSVFFNKQGPSTEFTPGAAVRYRFYHAINDVYLTFGLAMRMVGHETSKLSVADCIFKTQFTFEQFYFGFSYDVSISGIKSVTTRNGGPEVSLSVDLDFERQQPRYFKLIYE